jgi:hypothetical protein
MGVPPFACFPIRIGSNYSSDILAEAAKRALERVLKLT